MSNNSTVGKRRVRRKRRKDKKGEKKKRERRKKKGLGCRAHSSDAAAVEIISIQHPPKVVIANGEHVHYTLLLVRYVLQGAGFPLVSGRDSVTIQSLSYITIPFSSHFLVLLVADITPQTGNSVSAVGPRIS